MPIQTDSPFPTAQHVAVAVVAAARLTGESPVHCAQGRDEHGLEGDDHRCRHYAMHALAAVFPGHAHNQYARWCGAPSPKFYFRSSLWYVVGNGGGPHPRTARWWDGRGFAEVTEAVRAVPIPVLAPREPAPAPRPARPAPPSAPQRVAPAAIARPPARASALDRFNTRFSGLAESELIAPTRQQHKRSLHDMLREAVENTAKMTPPE